MKYNRKENPLIIGNKYILLNVIHQGRSSTIFEAINLQQQQACVVRMTLLTKSDNSTKVLQYFKTQFENQQEEKRQNGKIFQNPQEYLVRLIDYGIFMSQYYLFKNKHNGFKNLQVLSLQSVKSTLLVIVLMYQEIISINRALSQRIAISIIFTIYLLYLWFCFNMYENSKLIKNYQYKYQILNKTGSCLKFWFNCQKSRFSFECIILITLRTIDALKVLHSVNFIHANLNMQSILTSLENQRILSIGNLQNTITFKPKSKIGQKCQYLNKYSSLGQHLGIQVPPKDDLESLLYKLIQLLTDGEYFDQSKKFKTRAEKLQRYFPIKHSFLPEKALKNYPTCFTDFAKKIKFLNPMDLAINYDNLKDIKIQNLTGVIQQIEQKKQWKYKLLNINQKCGNKIGITISRNNQ